MSMFTGKTTRFVLLAASCLFVLGNLYHNLHIDTEIAVSPLRNKNTAVAQTMDAVTADLPNDKATRNSDKDDNIPDGATSSRDKKKEAPASSFVEPLPQPPVHNHTHEEEARADTPVGTSSSGNDKKEAPASSLEPLPQPPIQNNHTHEKEARTTTPVGTSSSGNDKKEAPASSLEPLRQPPIQNHTHEKEAKTAPSLPLRPPFKILSLGEPRSGSTFNHQLLYALASIKSPPDEKVRMTFEKTLQGNTSYVAKVHSLTRMKTDNQAKADWNDVGFFEQAMNDGISIFITTHDRENIKFPSHAISHALHVQEVDNLINCSLCEVDAYTDIFNLTDTEVKLVKDYMGAYESIRQCCGLQSSKWERMRLAGCNITEEEKRSPLYPHCEDRNKTEAELILASRPGNITYLGMDPTYNWMKVGDCQRFDYMLMNGKGFNGINFTATEENCNKLKNGNKKKKKKEQGKRRNL